MERLNFMKKIAIISTNLACTGISTVIMNYCKNINLKKFEITIFAGAPIDEYYKGECKKLGIDIIELPYRRPKVIKYYISLFRKMKKNHYDIVHVHGNSYAMFMDLFIAKLKKIKIRISHCHSTRISKVFSSKPFELLFNLVCTERFACGDLVGKTLYKNKDFYIIRNGIDTSKYCFDSKTRADIRSKLGVNDKIILGHIGRFNESKNHKFLLEIFEKIASLNDKYVLLLVGNGPDFIRIKDIINKSKYKNRIILYGESNEIEKMYFAMDIFVFPSLYEGFPLTLVEAQVSGLPCIISDVITDEVVLCDLVKKKSIVSSDLWINEILSTKTNLKRKEFYNSNLDIIKTFDIKECSYNLEKRYLDLIEKSK